MLGLRLLVLQLSALTSQIAPMVTERVVVVGEAYPLHDADHEEVAQHGHDGRAGGGRQPEGTYLTRVARGEDDVDLCRQWALDIARDEDEGEGGVHAARQLDELHDLTRLTRVADQQHQVTRADHTEVAMLSLAGMEEVGGRPCRAEGRGDVVRDLSRLAHT